MKWAIATGFTMKSGENCEDFHHQLLLRRYQPARACPRGVKLLVIYDGLLNLGIFWAQKLVYHMFHG